ncbi:hypothetical protein EG346_02965 [Chryseobacterium carnipullorum]|uniref:Cytochrome c family protein n=1 Tax=Chryseobacterium carnipullorum TaxID=1124835 RepID=A0A376EG07_CHRCU|nr:hypothetical protein [Chryseobacterium carnipullorum]AZA47203.1 hypothetical protein EG346_02965 [Chryseobacterium carnipullorum]AZA66550.1 hypothetical protein EG345_19065 [Chryseobacterium carnipullorum]STD08630.1 Uncharacterised protein [Chryseobacterium carnipullorum]
MRTLLFSFFLLSLISISCESGKKDKKLNSRLGFSKEMADIDCGAFCDPPTVGYQLPADSTCGHSSQSVLNCFAWKNFLALNWRASDERGLPDTTAVAADYGMPGDYSPTVWESYLSADDVFAAKQPEQWNLKSKNGYIKYINEINKFTDINASLPKPKLRAMLGGNVDEIMQAKGAWLTDQSGNIVWYEIRMNSIESDFIRKNKLYSSENLNAFAAKNQGVWLPMESIEIKAAWRVIPENQLESLKNFYKISKAMVPEIKGFDKNNQPIYGKYTQKYLGLVGLHIIRKTNQSPQFTWMTFEHVNNAPTEGQVDPSVKYCFYNPKSTDKPNQSPVPGKDSLSKPVQVIRIANNAITPEIQNLNKQIRDMIKASNPKSVWQYYQLVNVQWPENPIQDGNNNKTAPLMDGGITPNNIANVTMETYIQEKQCMDCHKNASVGAQKYPTDYSFIFLKVKQAK